MHNKHLVPLASALALAIRPLAALSDAGDAAIRTRWSWQENYAMVMGKEIWPGSRGPSCSRKATRSAASISRRTTTWIPLARTPNWKVSNTYEVKSEWWVWDNPGKAFGNTIKNASGQAVHLGIDTKHIKDKPEDYFKGALIWPEYG